MKKYTVVTTSGWFEIEAAEVVAHSQESVITLTDDAGGIVAALPVATTTLVMETTKGKKI